MKPIDLKFDIGEWVYIHAIQKRRNHGERLEQVTWSGESQFMRIH